MIMPEIAEAQSLPKLKLLQYPSVMHDRFLRVTASNAGHNLSTMTIFDAVSKIVEIHRVLVENDKTCLLLIGQDLERAALSITNYERRITSGLVSRGPLTSLILQQISLLSDVTPHALAASKDSYGFRWPRMVL